MSDLTSHRSRILQSVNSVWMTLLTGLLALITASSPARQSWLQFDAAAIRGGETWRFLTGHLTHWNLDHFFWDFSVFMLLGVLCERRNRTAFAATVATSATLISLYLMTGLADVTTYRGLSGIDTGLFCLWCVSLLNDARTNNDRFLKCAAAAAFCGLLFKIAWEFGSQSTLFVDHATADFIPMPLAHVAGLLCGLAVAAVAGRSDHSGLSCMSVSKT